MQQDSSGAWISSDGLWRWDGQAWIPNPAGNLLVGRLSFGDVISIPTRDPRWLRKCGIEGLISLIPIYGSFEILGWSFSYLDNLRAGRPELPEDRFGYAGRGARAAVVALIYGVAAIVLFYSLFGVFMFLIGPTASSPSTTTGSTASSATSPFPAVFFAGFLALEGMFFVFYALAHLVVVPIILRTERSGIAAGLNLFGAIRLAASDLRTAGVAAILVFLVVFFAGLGIYACFVGVVFSYGYGAAMLAASVRWYEQRSPAPDLTASSTLVAGDDR